MQVLQTSKIIVCLFLCLFSVDALSQWKNKLEGFIQSSGLPDSFKKKLNLDFSEYLLADTENSYLIESKEISKAHWGKYVRIYGEIIEPKEWVYNTKILKVDSVVIVPFQNKKSMNTKVVLSKKNEPKTLNGELVRKERPAPDIAYDYLLKIKEPIKRENPPSGEEYVLIYEIPVSWADINMINEFEHCISEKKPITLKGNLVSGYAESLVFETIEIK